MDVTHNFSKEIDASAKDASECLIEGEMSTAVFGGIPVYSSESNLVDIAPEVKFQP